MDTGRSVVIGVVALFLVFAAIDLGLNYAETHRYSNPQAAAAVTQQLTASGIAAKRVLCDSDPSDPKNEPAVQQIVALHPNEKPKLYRCNVELQPKDAETLDPTVDRSFCVVGFGGSTPWTAIETKYLGCGSLAESF